MRVSRGWSIAAGIHCATVLAALVLFTAHPLAAEEPSAADGSAQLGRDPSRPAPVCEPSLLDSPYIPVDSWVYPATLRLYSLGFVDTVFLGLRLEVRLHFLFEIAVEPVAMPEVRQPAADFGYPIHQFLSTRAATP